MKRILSVLLALIMVVGLVACGGDGDTSTPSNPGTSVTTSTAPSSSGGTTPDTPKTPSRTDVNLSINTAWTTSNPMASNNVQDNLIFWNMSDFLFFMNESTGQIENRIAKSYTTSADGLTWTFELRDDVKFHNGDPLKASDVAYSIKYAKELGRRGATTTKPITDVVAKGDYTVEITLSEPYAPLLPGLCTLPILSEKVVTEQGDKFGTTVHEAGCGPYKLVEMKADSKIVLEAFEDYYLGKAAIKTINYSVITDSATATVAFESGDLDWYNCSVTDYTRIMADGKYGGESLSANHLTYLAINPASQNAPALADKKVRQAICHAINLTELNYAAFDGTAGEAIYMMPAETNYAFPTSGLNSYEYNVEKAKSLLAEAGYASGVYAGKLLCFTGSYFEVVATMIQSQLAAAGINVELEWNEQATVVARGKVQDYDMFVSGVTWNGDANHFCNYACNDKREGTYIHYDATFDHAYLMAEKTAAAQTSDVNKRMQHYATIHNYFMDYAGLMPLLYKSVPIVYDKSLNPVNYPAYQQVFYWSWN